MTDDQRADTLEVMSRTRRWFVAEGMTFTQAFAATPLCCPSRASIFTGRYPHNHGVLNNSMAWRLDHRTTLQRYLHEAGYGTAIAGKFLNGWDLSQAPPYFDAWALFDENDRYFDVAFNVEGEMRTVREYSTHYIGDQAVRFIREFERHDQRPWLLYVTPFAPHTPYTPAPEDRNVPVPGWSGNPAVKETDLSDKPQWLRQPELGLRGGQRTRGQQLRTLMSVDELVGRLVHELERLGEERRTLAFYLSDNGLFWAEHSLRGKSQPYTQSVLIPFLMRWEGHLPAGLESDRLVSTIDVAPTVLAAARIPRSRLHALDGRNLMSPSRARLLLEHFTEPVRPRPDWASIRTRSYQYVEHYSDGGTVIFREYYDLAGDPWQLTNKLQVRHTSPSPRRVARLSRLLARDRGCRGIAGPRACP